MKENRSSFTKYPSPSRSHWMNSTNDLVHCVKCSRLEATCHACSMICNYSHIFFIIYVLNTLTRLINLGNLYDVSQVETSNSVLYISNGVINKGPGFRASSRSFIIVFSLKFSASYILRDYASTSLVTWCSFMTDVVETPYKSTCIFVWSKTFLLWSFTFSFLTFLLPLSYFSFCNVTKLHKK